MNTDNRRNIDNTGRQVKNAVSQAGDSRVVEWGAKLGYAASGLVHLLIAWIALQVALGRGGGEADQSGAFKTLAQQPLGRALLVTMVVGLALLAVWQVFEAVRGHETKDRVKAAGKAVAYLALASPAVAILRSKPTSSGEQTEGVTKTLLTSGFGVVLVVVAGLGLVAIGGYHIYKGLKEKFLEDLTSHPGRGAVVAGKIGYCAKGLALALAGVLLAWAALSGDTDKAHGLDAGIKSVLELPFGKFLMVAMAAGLACYGVYSFFRARYAKV